MATLSVACSNKKIHRNEATPLPSLVTQRGKKILHLLFSLFNFPMLSKIQVQPTDTLVNRTEKDYVTRLVRKTLQASGDIPREMFHIRYNSLLLNQDYGLPGQPLGRDTSVSRRLHLDWMSEEDSVSTSQIVMTQSVASVPTLICVFSTVRTGGFQAGHHSPGCTPTQQQQSALGAGILFVCTSYFILLNYFSIQQKFLPGSQI